MKLFLLLITCLAFGTSSLQADPAGRFEVSGDYLYLRPSFDDTYFVIEADATGTAPTGKRKHNDPDFHSGFRAGGAYHFCDCDRAIQVYYSHLQAEDTNTVTGSFLWATLGRADLTSSFENYAGSARSELEFKYNQVDVRFSQGLWNCCGGNVSLQLGLEYANLHLDEDYTYAITAGSTALIHQKSRARGVGPQVGFGYDYTLFDFPCSCPGSLKFTALTSGSLLVASSKASENDILVADTLLDVRDRATWRVIPAFHTRLGLNYTAAISCFHASLELGYQFSSYFRGLSRTKYSDDTADSQCNTHYYNFDLQGLYVSGAIRF